MLRELQIQNFGLFRDVHLTVEPGLTVVTGESGAGKSLLLQAMLAAFGARTGSERMGPWGNSFKIRLGFDLCLDHPVWKELEPLGIEADEWLVISRDSGSDGRSVYRVQGQGVPAQAIKRIAPFLLDVSMQHQALRLLQPSETLWWLDRFGHLDDQVHAVRQAYLLWKESAAALETLLQMHQEEERLTAIRAEWEELQGLKLSPEEEETLQRQLDRARASQRLLEQFHLVHDLLEGRDEAGVVAAMQHIVQSVEQVASWDETMQPWSEQLVQAATILDDFRVAWSEWAQNVQLDPKEMEELESRADQLARIKRKYGRDLPGLIAYQEQLQQEILTADDQSWRIDRQRQQVDQYFQAFQQLAQQLSRAR
ncbi:MAG: AAA family ATPase, partial [Firmicutes bacterium]|nr:AAA family ATPase [Bacillota bacterium]